MKMTNRIQSAAYLRDYEFMFKCPLCDSSMRVVEHKSLICNEQHTFDVSKQGYMNMLTHQIHTKYDKGLFSARRRVLTEGKLFTPLGHAVVEMIKDQPALGKGALSILDTGCGEGSLLVQICKEQRADKHSVVGVGIDISKEGVLAASRDYQDYIWCAADLAKTPFQDKQFNVILNILSPSNYAEFERLLQPEGLLIKVVPQSGHLQELRAGLMQQEERKTYSNKDTVERFDSCFHMVDRRRVTYTVQLQKELLKPLIQMTPLSWATTEEQIEQFLDSGISAITVDLELLVGAREAVHC